MSGSVAVRRARIGTVLTACGLAFATVLGASLDALAQNCTPRRSRPAIVLSGMGPCQFIPELASFSGGPIDQALCLMRAADHTRNLGPLLTSLPQAIISRVGQSDGLPERTALAIHLTELGLLWDFAPFLWQPISRAGDNKAQAPQARYFVIHDTSSPFIGSRPFPADIDENRSINNLARYRCQDDWAFAHVVINRSGAMLLGRELNQPWRATKFERATRFGTDLKGLFLHIELVQPRGQAPGRGGRNDARAPIPGFSRIQYERLALVYVIASVRSERWLVPAFHAAIDSGISGGHDDPQHFSVESFAAAIDRLVGRLQEQTRAAELTEQSVTASAATGDDLGMLGGRTP